MAKNVVVWDGLAEYREVLRTLPEACTGEAAKLIDGAANGLAVAVRSAYPVRTGKLRDSVSVTLTPRGSRLKAGAVVKNTARHAVIFERGTQARHTEIGANRGSMPPGKVFIPRAAKARRALTQDLKAMVLRRGASAVTGDA